MSDLLQKRTTQFPEYSGDAFKCLVLSEDQWKKPKDSKYIVMRKKKKNKKKRTLAWKMNEMSDHYHHGRWQTINWLIIRLIAE